MKELCTALNYNSFTVAMCRVWLWLQSCNHV